MLCRSLHESHSLLLYMEVWASHYFWLASHCLLFFTRWMNLARSLLIFFDFSKKQLLALLILSVVYLCSILLISILNYCIPSIVCLLGEGECSFAKILRQLSKAMHLKLKIFLYVLFSPIFETPFLSFGSKHF